MAIVNTLKIYEILKERLAEPEAKIITEAIEKSFEEAKEILATKEDLTRLETRLIRWMFIFWVVQIGVILSILFTFFR